MDIDSIMLSATHETEKDKNCMILLIRGIKSNKKTNKNKLIDTGNRMVVTRGEGEGGGQRR